MNESDLQAQELALRQLNQSKGIQTLSGLLSAGSLGENSPEDPSDHTGTILASGIHDDSFPDSLRDAENEKRTKDMSRLLEQLGAPGVDLLNPKFKDKFLAKASRLIGKAPGARRLAINDAKSLTHTVLHAAANGGLNGLQSVIEHKLKHARNLKAIKARVAGLFGELMPQNDALTTKEREKIHRHVSENLLNEQISAGTNMAEGGRVTSPVPLVDETIANLHPERAMMLTAAKTRAHGYLNSLRPQPSTKLPFDREIKDDKAEKNYHRAIELSAKPLSVLNHIKAGTISPSDFQHFAQLHPELHELLKKQITKKITEGQLIGKKPSYKTRQGLSLFMGHPLESNLSPMAIQAAQATFTSKQSPQNQAPEKAKKNTAPLSKFSKEYRTPEQARLERENK